MEDQNKEVSNFELHWSPLNALLIDTIYDEDLQNTLMELVNNTNTNTDPQITEPEGLQAEDGASATNIQAQTDHNPINPSTESTNEKENMSDTTIFPEFDANFMNMTESDIENFIDGQQNKNTLKKTVREVAIVTKFLKLKNENRELNKIPPNELDPLLANFLLTVRKKDGSEFEPSSLRSIVGSIDRKLRRQKYGHTVIESKSHPDDVFRLTREALKAKQKLLKQKGKGNKPRRAQPITDEEITMLYRKNVLGDSCPDSLLNTIWLNNCVHFGLRGVQEHYTLRWGDVTLNTSSDGTRYLELNERQTMTRTGENISDVREVSPKIYECEGEMNPLKYYDIYAAKRPAGYNNPEDPFYLSVRTIPLEDSRSDKWFLRQRVGERKLGSIVKIMKEKGGLDKNKRLTNHSARKYLVQKLRENNVEGTDIMQISGHRNIASVNNYSAMSDKQQQKISNILSNTAGQSALTVANLPRRTSTITAPVSITNDTQSLTPHNNDIAPSFRSQTNMSSQISSMFHGATLHINTLNVYTRTEQ